MAETDQHLTGRSARLLKALVHNLRFRIMIVLTDSEATPKELSEILGSPFRRVCEQVKLLEEEGWIELVGTDKRQGGTQHIYSATVRPFVSTAESEGLTVEERERMSAPTVHSMILDMLRAEEAGTLDLRPERVLVRMPLVLDAEGYKEADESAIRHMEEMQEIQARAAERLLSSGEQGMNTASAITVYQMPESAA